MRPRRTVAAIAAGIAVALTCASVFAQDYPTRPIRLVVPAAGGGPADIVARVVGEKLAEAWKQPVVIDNRPDSNQIIGTHAVAKAAPDGYTLLLVVDSSFTMLPHAMAQLPYDVEKDFEPVTTLANAVVAIIANEAVPGRTLEEALAAVKARPGEFTYGSGTLGSQLVAERLAMLSGTQLLHVPYKGSAQTALALLGGQIDFAVTGITAFLSSHAEGKVRILATSGERRAPALPDVPTLAESGFPGFDGVWLGLAAPAGTPASVIEEISARANEVLDQQAVRDRLDALGMSPMPNTPENTRAFIRTESDKWADVIKQAGISLK